jgi:hypothetical protein
VLVPRAGVIGMARARAGFDRRRQLLASQVLRQLDLHDLPVVAAGWTRDEAVCLALGRLRLQRPSTLFGFGSGHNVMVRRIATARDRKLRARPAWSGPCRDEVGHARNLPLRLCIGVRSLDADQQFLVKHGEDPLQHGDRRHVVPSLQL